MLRYITLALLATFLLTSLPGCLSSGSVSQFDGPNIGDHTLAEIKPAETSQEWVLAVLGEPTKKAIINDPNGTVEVWKWVRRKVTTIKGSALVVSSKSKSEEVRTVYVEFKDGVVTRAWRD